MTVLHILLTVAGCGLAIMPRLVNTSRIGIGVLLGIYWRNILGRPVQMLLYRYLIVVVIVTTSTTVISNSFWFIILRVWGKVSIIVDCWWNTVKLESYAR